jgi:hypothetical protein
MDPTAIPARPFSLFPAPAAHFEQNGFHGVTL